jgi:hypothetical protein
LNVEAGHGHGTKVRILVRQIVRKLREATRTHRWRHAIVRPGGSPFSNLAAELQCNVRDLRASSQGLVEQMHKRLVRDECLLLVIDQFEELFRYKDRSRLSTSESAAPTAGASDALAFVELLLAASQGPLPTISATVLSSQNC